MVTIKSFTKPDNPQRGPGNRGINIDGNWYGVIDKVYEYYHNKTPLEASEVKKDESGKVTFLTVTSTGGGYNRQSQSSGQTSVAQDRQASIEDSARLRRRTDSFIMANDLVVAGMLPLEGLREYAETLNDVIEGKLPIEKATPESKSEAEPHQGVPTEQSSGFY